jgi:cell division protein FtsL
LSAKTELLDEIDLVLNPQKGVDLNHLLYVLLTIALVCIVIFPKIYIQQQIYYKSRDISKLKSEYDTLKEENRLIKGSVESIRFKNQILDTLF